ncbi:MAG TPA: BREX-1 system phosphatase PglZ type A [Chloroflexi bacterium]|nr:BREX-1 system phosphatase PglZ type A [Chloroflexota bacterium]
MTEIEQALTRIFDRHRIVFWYDVKRELAHEFDALALPGVEKIALENNEFGVKHRILRQQPDHKFLLYHEGPPPPDLENWLLDVQLAHGEFRADQVSLWLSEIGLGLEFTDVVAPHTEFFQAARRREALKELLKKDDTPRQVHLKMVAVCARAEPRLDDILKNLLDELAGERTERLRLIERSGLSGFLWEQLERAYGYTSESPGLRDFAITLFQSCYAMGVGEAARLNSDALVFLKQWKDSVRYQEAFATLSADCADILNVEQDLQERDYRTLLAVETFELADRKILSDLVRDVAQRTISGSEVEKLIRQRRRSHWYDAYRAEYAAVEEAAAFLETLDRVDLTVRAVARGEVAPVVEQYARVWSQLDQRYRKFITHIRRSGQTTLFDALAQIVENKYTNAYLLKVNNQWQIVVDELETWDARPVLPQQRFFERLVAPFLARENKVFVVISDGLRYEIGEELLRLVRQEDRYDAEIEPALTLLPSYTQLGMAALLPHERMEIASDYSTVLVDGESSAGTANRKKILDRALPGRATAVRAEELLAMNRDESRALTREHDVVYVYHNRIDAVGDKRDSEERVFDAAEATLEELVRIIKKLANANANNMLVTSDHGFIYQNQALDESDFAGQDPAGAEIGRRNRRFVLGRGLRETSSFKRFTAAQMGLEGDVEMLIPKSINRLRVSGAGSRYVHGGASLQEVVIPVLKINKKRESDIRQVGVDILRTGSSVITSGQLSVTFYQTEAATEKVQPRRLRAGIYTQGGVLISDRHELLFDLASENPREREMPVRFILTQKADAANQQEVLLRLDEQVEGTSHYREVKTVRYILRRAFTSDFDF